MERLDNISIDILNEELKRLHDLLTLTVCDESMRNRVLDMIQSLHKANFYPTYFIPKGEV